MVILLGDAWELNLAISAAPPLGQQHGCPFESSGAQIGERLIGLLQPVARGLGDDAYCRREAQEVEAVLPCEISDRNELALSPQQPVGKSWNTAHMDAGADYAAPFAHLLERQRDQIPHGGVDDRGVERLGRRLVGPAGPGGTESPRERLRRGIARACEGEYRSPLPACGLGHDMPRGAEPV